MSVSHETLPTTSPPLHASKPPPTGGGSLVGRMIGQAAVRSSTLALGAFFWTEAMPFLALAFDE